MSQTLSERPAAPESGRPDPAPAKSKPFYTQLSFQIVIGLIAGLVLGLAAVAIGTVGEA